MSAPRKHELKRTPLFPLYDRYAAKVVDFHGWALPVQFRGIMEEHAAVRGSAGLFDISHMGEIEVSGAGALDFIQLMTINDASKLRDGQVQYTAMCFDDGGIVDDLTIYRHAAEKYILCVNAANTAKDLDWLLRHRQGDVEVVDRSDETALLALQGPKAEFVLKSLSDLSIASLPYYHFVEGEVGGVKAVISRTGYTGEDGFELFTAAGDSRELWQKIMAAGGPAGLAAAGLGARDTLRLEMKYALYGNDIDGKTDPIEAGLGWITKAEKGDFIGREALRRRLDQGPRRKLVGFEIAGRGIPRRGYRILAEGKEAGTVTSGTFSPSLKKGIGMGYVAVAHSRPGSALEIEVRGAKLEAAVVKTPFYKEGSVKK